MSTNHRGGNIQNEITLEEHDGTNNAKRTTLVSASTIYAVVNTGAANAGNVTLDPGSKTQIAGNVTLSDAKTFIGLVTAKALLYASDGTAFNHSGGNLLVNVQNFAVGQYGGQATTATNLTSALVFAENLILKEGTWQRWDGSVTISHPISLAGNVTLSDPKTYIGLTTTTLGAGDRYIGLATVTHAGNVTLNASNANIGSVSILGGSLGITGNVTLSDPKTFIGLVTTQAADPKGYIGLVTVTQASNARTITGNVTLSDAKTYIGLATVTLDNSRNIGIAGNVTLSDAKTFIGLVTAWSRNAGTTKTLVSLPVGLGNNSLATVAVPTNSQKINVTNFLLSSNVTTEIAIKSGVTYLTGNASLGVTLFPGGGFELPGSPDSPSWIGLPSGALVVEKRDPGGTVSKIGGGLIYFDE